MSIKLDANPECQTLAHRLRQRLARAHGVTAIEYALIAAMIFLVIVIAVRNVGIETKKPYDTIATEMTQ